LLAALEVAPDGQWRFAVCDDSHEGFADGVEVVLHSDSGHRPEDGLIACERPKDSHCIFGGRGFKAGRDRSSGRKGMGGPGRQRAATRRASEELERDRAIEPIYEAAQLARTPADCARVDKQIEELARRAIP
jgi:hypothetical protein